MKQLSDFLLEFNQKLNARCSKGFTFSKLLDDVRYRRIPLNDKNVTDVEELNFDYLDKLNTVVDSLISISKTPKFELKEIYDVKRREQVTKVDVKSIRETNKKQAYWEMNNQGFTPKEMVSTINEIDYGTYENRFIVMFIDQLLQFVNRQINMLVSRIDSLNNNFMNASAMYSDSKEIDKLIRFKTFRNAKARKGLKPVLINGDSDFEKPLHLLNRVRVSLYNLMNSQFYKDVKRAPGFNESTIRKTNVFTGEHNYRNCFEFYREFKKLNKRAYVYAKVNRNLYKDYVTVSTIKALKQLGFKFKNTKQKLAKKHMSLHNIAGVNKDGVICKIKTFQNDIELTFEVKYLNGKFHKTAGLNTRRFSKVALLINPIPAAKISKDEYVDFIKTSVDNKINKGFDNVFAVIPNVGVLRDDTIVVSPDSQKTNNNLINAISSCLIFVEANQNIYSRVCPVCGSKINAIGEEGTFHCPICESSYAFLVSGDNKKYQTTLWIKRIKSIE